MKQFARSPGTGQFAKMVLTVIAKRPYSSSLPTVITLIVNGQPRQFLAPLTVAQLLAQLDLGGRRLALERNGAIVPRSLHASTLLAPQDRIEIVIAVGGG